MQITRHNACPYPAIAKQGRSPTLQPQHLRTVGRVCSNDVMAVLSLDLSFQGKQSYTLERQGGEILGIMGDQSLRAYMYLHSSSDGEHVFHG